MSKLASIVQAALGVVLLGSSIAKLAGAADADRDRLAVAAWFWMVAAVVELVGALGLLVGLKVRHLTVPASFSVAALMVGALAAHVRAGDSPAAMLPAALVLGTALVLATAGAGFWNAQARSERAPAGSAD